MSEQQILIVDDDPALLEALPEALRLRMAELSIETADSARAALERIAATEYDALVVDIKMPGMDGLELLSAIRQRRPETPTLLITGHGDHDLAVQALRAGAYDYVTKPIDRDYFVASLSRALECHRLSREVAGKRLELTRHLEELETCVQERTLELREALHREVTARAELDQARAEMEELHRQREEFISLIAHDLAGPMTTIRGYAEMLGRPKTAPEVQERARVLIMSETRRMARLTEDLADAAHLAAGQFRIKQEPCDLAAIAREQVELAASRTDRHTIDLDVPGEMPTDCDRDRIGQVLANLLSNAIKYAPGGRILVRAWREDGRARLSVSDEGPGIPAQQAEMIFQPGQRFDNGGANGAGLGLHIARGIAEAHGGEIWVESEPGRGATFHVSLPLAPVAVEPHRR
jgi:two-component system, sensor histidine kinase and response regulator